MAEGMQYQEEFKMQFSDNCINMALNILRSSGIRLNSSDISELEYFVKAALRRVPEETLSVRAREYESRLRDLMERVAEEMSQSRRSFREIIQKICPWHPWC